MHKLKKRILIIFSIILIIAFFVSQKFNLFATHEIGQQIDEYNGVAIYYNGKVGNINGRALTEDGYNLGLKYDVSIPFIFPLPIIFKGLSVIL